MSKIISINLSCHAHDGARHSDRGRLRWPCAVCVLPRAWSHGVWSLGVGVLAMAPSHHDLLQPHEGRLQGQGQHKRYTIRRHHKRQEEKHLQHTSIRNIGKHSKT